MGQFREASIKKHFSLLRNNATKFNIPGFIYQSSVQVQIYPIKTTSTDPLALPPALYEVPFPERHGSRSSVHACGARVAP
jgi:hypothetical protein